MTHSLHRWGAPEDLRDDFIVFAMPARGLNDSDAVAKQREFLRRALKYGPVNIGDGKKGGWSRPRKDLGPAVHWKRDAGHDAQKVIDAISESSLVTAVFDELETAQRFIREIRDADLGLSVNMSSLADAARACCEACGIVRHSVEFSLGFRGAVHRLPESDTLELSTMCGHGMISHAFAQQMIDRVKSGRKSPREAAEYLARFCVCSIFNPSRAARVLERSAGAVEQVHLPTGPR